MEAILDRIDSTLKEITPTITQTVCSMGLIGNFFSAIVLSRPQMRNSHLNILLLGLTFADGLYLVCGLGRVSGFVLDYIYLFARTSSIYMTLVLSIERLILIYWPFRARTFFTISRAKWILVFVFSFCLLISLPEFWTVWKDDSEPLLDFYSDDWEWIPLFILLLIPFLSVLILNTLIYIKLRQAAKRATTIDEMDESTAEENSITKMLVCVVVAFGFCYSFVFPHDLFYYWYWWWYWHIEGVSKVQRTYILIWWIFFYLNNIAICVNSSAKYIIYIAMGKKFRDEFNRITFQVFNCTKFIGQSEIVEN